MSNDLIIKMPGAGVATRTRPTKKSGTALIAATINQFHGPLSVAGNCRSELRTLQPVHKLDRYYLAGASSNHRRMLCYAAVADMTRNKLLPVVHPSVGATPTITVEIALPMLTALVRGVGNAKNIDPNILLANCVAMFNPRSNIIGEATGLWTPISNHPLVLALAIEQLKFGNVFNSTAELRTAMQAARSSLLALCNDTERWLELLKISDKVLFEFDRETWTRNYANFSIAIVAAMQDDDEEPYQAEDDDDESEPGSPRWCALEAMRRARSE